MSRRNGEGRRASRRLGDEEDPGASGEIPEADEVLLEAAGLDGDERAAYLEGVAAKDPEVAREVRKRLERVESVDDSFLEVGAIGRLLDAEDDDGLARLEDGESTVHEVPSGHGRQEMPDMPLEERYALGKSLGRGGMGQVVLAQDRQLQRRVALKFLRHRNLEVLRLLIHEARAQARVQHDHVLDVYDTGVLDGRPFISMRYVAGGTLNDVVPKLSLDARVRLLAQAAEGLHAAHRGGLLHRDVKPANILVEETDDGELRALVTDFGIATELETKDDSDTGLAGTPHYMAPERLSNPEAPADRRSDVYSLGATIHRVLTGAMPFDGKRGLELIRHVAKEEPARPRDYLPSLPRELEAIIQRCLARDPEERYSSAAAVAADLRRYLEGEVVEAYAAGLAYRLTRFALRNKVLVGMGAASVVLLAVAAVVVAIFAVQADRARHRAELRQGQAEELIRFMLVDLREKLESVGRLAILGDVGEAATEYFRSVPPEELSEEELLRRSRMLYQIGEVRIRTGDLAGAEEPMRESLELIRRLAELAPGDGERLFELGQSYFWVGYLHWEQGDLEAARPPFEDYLEVSERLVELDPNRLDWRRELAYAHSNLGSLANAEDELEEALAHFRTTLEIERSLLDPQGADAEARSELAATHTTIAVVLENLGRLGEAHEHRQETLEIRRRLGTSDPRARQLLATSLGHLGALLLMRGDVDGAAVRFREMQDILEELVSHDPSNTDWRFQLAWSHLMAGKTALTQDSFDDARENWRRASELLDPLLAVESPSHVWQRARATLLHRLAQVTWLDAAKIESPGRRAVRAREQVSESLAILRRLAVSRPTDRHVRRWLAEGHLLRGALALADAEAREDFERVVEVLEPLVAGSRDGRLLSPWARALRCLGRLDEARRAEAALEQTEYAYPTEVAECSLLLRSMSPESANSR